jgi:hypothetical protein
MSFYLFFFFFFCWLTRAIGEISLIETFVKVYFFFIKKEV